MRKVFNGTLVGVCELTHTLVQCTLQCRYIVRCFILFSYVLVLGLVTGRLRRLWYILLKASPSKIVRWQRSPISGTSEQSTNWNSSTRFILNAQFLSKSISNSRPSAPQLVIGSLHLSFSFYSPPPPPRINPTLGVGLGLAVQPQGVKGRL